VVVTILEREDRIATLMCEGLCRRFTAHRFLRRQRTVDEDKKDYWELIHECANCGAERVFGSEESEGVQ
jgi:hypothetical protein